MTLPAWIVHADWGSGPAKRVVATAELRDGRDGHYLARAAQRVGPAGGLLDRLHVPHEPAGRVLLGFDFPIGLPRTYAQRAGIGDFAGWFRGLQPTAEFFHVAETLDEVSLDRPFFPERVRSPSPGLKSAFHARLGLTGPELLRRCDHAHCQRRAAAEIFWSLGPQAVGKTTVSGWRDALLPGLTEPGRRYTLWPFDGELPDLLTVSDAVIVESYPAEAYGQLRLSMGARGTAKTDQRARRADSRRLLDICAQISVVPEPELVAEIDDGFGPSRSGEDRFDAVVGLFAMVKTIRERVRPDLPEDPAVRRHEGWIFGQHVTCATEA